MDNGRIIIVADSHVDDRSAEPFFALLDRIERSGARALFLGDIFELWIAIPRYETEIHRRFIDWCRRQRERPILIEGNHEFFVNRAYGDNLLETDGRAWSPPGWLEVGAVLAGHGDRINHDDWKYLVFRRAIRNPLTYALMYLFPFGPAIVERIRRKIKQTNQKYRCRLPMQFLERLPESLGAEGRPIVVGHFHQEVSLHDGRTLLLPAWREGGRIGRLDPATGAVELLLDTDL